MLPTALLIDGERAAPSGRSRSRGTRLVPKALTNREDRVASAAGKVAAESGVTGIGVVIVDFVSLVGGIEDIHRITLIEVGEAEVCREIAALRNLGADHREGVRARDGGVQRSLRNRSNKGNGDVGGIRVLEPSRFAGVQGDHAVGDPVVGKAGNSRVGCIALEAGAGPFVNDHVIIITTRVVDQVANGVGAALQLIGDHVKPREEGNIHITDCIEGIYVGLRHYCGAAERGQCGRENCCFCSHFVCVLCVCLARAVRESVK
jgi:hypothetical protein